MTYLVDLCLPTLNHFGTPGFLGSLDWLESGLEVLGLDGPGLDGPGLDGPGLESLPVEVGASSLGKLWDMKGFYILI